MLILTQDEALELFQSRIKKLFQKLKGRRGKRLRRMQLTYDMCHILTQEQQEIKDDLDFDRYNDMWGTL